MSTPAHLGATTAASRRAALAMLGAAAALPCIDVRPATATPEAMAELIGKLTGGARLNTGRIALDIPPLVENGNTVPCTVKVDSPMTAADHVRAIHLVNEKNPRPHVVSCRLGPRAGRAEVALRIRLNDTQVVTAIAEMSDGTFWTESASIIVTLGACLEDPV